MDEMGWGNGTRPGLRHERDGQTLEEQRNGTERTGEKTPNTTAEGQHSKK